jgi:hypothetical protein
MAAARAPSSFADYLKLVGLPASLADLAPSPLVDQVAYEQAPHLDFAVDAKEAERLWKYKVPRINPEGGCSRKKEYEAEPFQLDALMGVTGDLLRHPQTARQVKLYKVMSVFVCLLDIQLFRLTERIAESVNVCTLNCR